MEKCKNYNIIAYNILQNYTTALPFMQKSVKILLLISFLIIAVIIIFRYNPEEYSWFPKCLFYQLTGLQCPACGSQRAVHAALHGNFVQALKYNPFMIVSIPYAVGIVFATTIETPFFTKMRTILLRETSVYVYVVLFVFWWILRNII